VQCVSKRSHGKLQNNSVIKREELGYNSQAVSLCALRACAFAALTPTAIKAAQPQALAHTARAEALGFCFRARRFAGEWERRCM
jgi:hypothetical protein